MPADCVVQPHSANLGDAPILLEAKSAGDVTNTNKRRKEEAQKHRQLAAHYGASVHYVLFLCGTLNQGIWATPQRMAWTGYGSTASLIWICCWPDDFTDVNSKSQKHQSSTRRLSMLARDNALAGQKDVDSRRTARPAQSDGTILNTVSASHWTLYDIPLPGSLPTQSMPFLSSRLTLASFFSAFESSVRRLPKLVLATGVELDSEYAQVAARLWPGQALRSRECGFLGFLHLVGTKRSLRCSLHKPTICQTPASALISN